MSQHSLRVIVGGGKGRKPAAVLYLHDSYLECFVAVARAMQGKPGMLAAMAAVAETAKSQRRRCYV